MSSKTVTKHKPKSHPKGWLFCLAAALVVSLLALRAKRRRIRFAFAARSCRGAFHMRPKTSHIQNGRIWNPPLRSRLERANHGAKRSYPSAYLSRTVEDACPYKRYFTFLEKCVIITSTNNFQKLFLQKAVRGLLQMA